MLTDTAIRNFKPSAKPHKLSDGGGLHLLVQPNGSKLPSIADPALPRPQFSAVPASDIDFGDLRSNYALAVRPRGCWVSRYSKLISILGPAIGDREVSNAWG